MPSVISGSWGEGQMAFTVMPLESSSLSKCASHTYDVTGNVSNTVNISRCDNPLLQVRLPPYEDSPHLLQAIG